MILRFSPLNDASRTALAAMSLLAAAGIVPAAHALTASPVMAHAGLVDAQGASKGSVEIIEKGGLEVTVKAIGLTPGVHGVHIHTVGTCTAPDFASAGGHWNPTAKHHGMENPDGAHMGDLPNITIGADGTGTLTFTVPGASLSGGDTPLLDADGAAIVVHAGPDDMKTDPSGNSGGRVACGVIGAH
ncbi:MAG: superoxide dismutase family protein [Sphingomonadaceae bacterium]|jgi:Cu-Zn family superoxide dismutase